MSTTDTERDEPLSNGVDALIDLLTARTLEVTRLNREVARLDAVVTAQAEMHDGFIRSLDEPADEEMPDVFDASSGTAERAGRQRTGFQIPARTQPDPYEEDDRR